MQKKKTRYIIDRGIPVIDNFYSDSLADMPLALCAEKAHLVKNHANTVVDWPDLDKETMARLRKKSTQAGTVIWKNERGRIQCISSFMTLVQVVSKPVFSILIQR
jgi:hypothetical protein